MQLLNITTTPMRYELKIERARLEMSNPDKIPQANVRITPPEMKMDSQNISVRLDSYEARSSLGIKRIDDAIRANAENSIERFNRNVRETVEFGKNVAKIEDDATICSVLHQKMMEQPELYTMFLPSGGVDISWEPNRLDLSFTSGDVDYEWEKPQMELTYVPGSIRLEILEFAKVDIEYVGSPIYIPKSSDPDYVAPEQ